MAKIIINGKTEFDDGNDPNKKAFQNFNDLPPEIRQKIETKLQNNPDAMQVFKEELSKQEQSDSGSSFNKNSYNNSFHSMNNNASAFMPMNTAKKSFPWAGIIVPVMIIGFVVGIIYFTVFSGAQFAQTYALKGDTTHFDPIASLNEVRATFDANAKLTNLEITGVRPDGTMDLTASYKPTATYDFYHEVPLPKDAPPIGAGGNTSGKWYEEVTATVYTPGQWNHVTSTSANTTLDYSYSNKGIDLDRGSDTGTPGTLLPDPTCSIKDLWTVALQKGAPQNAVADITYDETGYAFSISGSDFNSLQFDNTCKLQTN